jgi:RNA polymerase sigma-70 factor (ECF subfamily)
MVLLAPESEKCLIQRFKEGQREAFAQMMQMFSPAIFRQTYLLLGSAQEAEDACQEVLLKAYLGRKGLRGDRFLPWLSQIARFHCIDCLRKRKKLPQTAQEILPEAIPEVRTESSQLPEYLEELAETERLVILFRIVDGLGYKEIAEITGLTEGTLRNLFSRTMKTLRHKLENL